MTVAFYGGFDNLNIKNNFSGTQDIKCHHVAVARRNPVFFILIIKLTSGKCYNILLLYEKVT